MRRQRRMAELQDKQDRQRMGLLPPDPPKGNPPPPPFKVLLSCWISLRTVKCWWWDVVNTVKLSNMMKVLTSDAVADPTKIEARVRREMLQRRKAHEKANESRQLTDDQRKEKITKRREVDECRGIFTSVYKLSDLFLDHHLRTSSWFAKDADQRCCVCVCVCDEQDPLPDQPFTSVQGTKECSATWVDGRPNLQPTLCACRRGGWLKRYPSL